MADARRKLLATCTGGDVAALEALFSELDIGPDHPHTPYDFPQGIPEEQRLPSVTAMLVYAIEGESIDLLRFLCGKFPGTSCFNGPMRAAINTGNTAVLKIVSEFDPESTSVELGDDSLVNALGYACTKKNGAELVKILLDAGANPNVDPPFRMPANWNVSSAIINGLPTSTFKQFLDAGYAGNDPFAIKLAVEHQRPDVFELLCSRGRRVPDAYFPPEEELIMAANENKDPDMVAMIKRAYASRSRSGKGFLATLVGKIRSRN
ncbi:hypothetical protein DM02DRAFT_732965 [Periconia macrospinosa]|uniref:Peptidase A2 domain-containing protein n=1 Tax=Periconia macrospinosa TaxID=97972 RepID=A0A2V1D6M5_9PLEO|nr:hypothetical protein DM02DRAFT_732965 [Periconia macrospinosa]